jgi:hypothetical protein
MSKNRQMGLLQIKKFLHIKGNNYQNQETKAQNGRKSLPAIEQVND